MAETSLIKSVAASVALPEELTIKFKGAYELCVFQDILLFDASKFNLEATIKVMMLSILKELYFKISVKLAAEKTSYKIKLKAFEQVAVFMVCLKSVDDAAVYEKELLRSIINQIHQNFTNG